MEQVRVVLSDGLLFQEGVMAPQVIQDAGCSFISKGSIIRILEHEMYASIFNESKRIIKVLNVEVLVPSFRVVGNPIPCCLEELKEEQWDEDTWAFLDPEEQEWEHEDEDEDEEGPCCCS